VQGATNVTRMDYASPLSNELVFSMAVEQLLDVEVPPRATWIRMYLNELNRIASHLLWQATNGLDMGALSMIIYGWREREETLRLLEKITGLRMNNNYIRPGGVAASSSATSSRRALPSTTSCSPGTRSGRSAWSAWA
jgi:NADH-quinone oxidoreductase subunit D